MKYPNGFARHSSRAVANGRRRAPPNVRGLSARDVKCEAAKEKLRREQRQGSHGIFDSRFGSSKHLSIPRELTSLGRRAPERPTKQYRKLSHNLRRRQGVDSTYSLPTCKGDNDCWFAVAMRTILLRSRLGAFSAAIHACLRNSRSAKPSSPSRSPSDH